MNKHHDVQILGFDGAVLKLQVDGRLLEVDPARESSLLAGATQAERERVEVSPSGYGLHWPLVDEDLSIDGLLGIVHSPSAAGANQ